MCDLFTSHNDWTHFDLPDADVSLLPRLQCPLTPDALLATLIAETSWRQEPITLYGKSMLQPRLIAWVADTQVRYGYSRRILKRDDWTPLLIDLKAIVEDATKAHFNAVLLNLYRDERDSMGMHSDDERELGPNPVIASLSLGATRTFVMKHKTRRDLPTTRIELESGSLLLMRGTTQHHWRHGIPKRRHAHGPRINFTFRYVAD